MKFGFLRNGKQEQQSYLERRCWVIVQAISLAKPFIFLHQLKVSVI